MTDAIRTDIHRPLALVPEDYLEAGWYDLGGAEEPPQMRLSDAVHRDFSLWGGVYTDELWRCDHCGARLRYGCELVHRPSGSHIHVGETCLNNRFSRSTAEFQRLRRTAALDRQAQRLLQASLRFRADHPEVAWADLDACGNAFIADVLRKLRQYGDISARQLEAIQTAYERDAQRAAVAVGQFLAGLYQPQPRNEFIGQPGERLGLQVTVRSIRSFESQWGQTTLYGMVDDQGRSLRYFSTGSFDAERDQTLTIRATVKAHEDYQGERQTVLTRAVVQAPLHVTSQRAAE